MHTKSMNICLKENEKISSVKKLLHIVKDFEMLGNKIKIFGTIYHKIFYKKVINNEIKIGKITKQSKVLHIGSGPFPMTAVQLIKQGIRVDCADNDSKAMEYSKKLINKCKNNHLVNILFCDGKNIDYSKYDVIILSLHVTPKNVIINKILSSVKEGSRIVYRNPRGFFDKFYPKYYPENGFNKTEKIKQSFGKESVALIR